MKAKIISATQNYGPVVARILIGGMFLLAGITKVTGFAGTVGYIESIGLGAASLFAVIAIVVEILGGLFVLIGYRAFIGAGALAIFTIVATALFHMNLSDQVQMIMFNKNLAIVGGLLYIMAYGSGPYSVGYRPKAPEQPVVDMEKSGDFGA